MEQHTKNMASVATILFPCADNIVTPENLKKAEEFLEELRKAGVDENLLNLKLDDLFSIIDNETRMMRPPEKFAMALKIAKENLV